MNGEQLYQSLKQGKIKKTQLNDSQLGEVYKYMINSGKTSVNSFKPEAIKYYNLDNKVPTPVRRMTGKEAVEYYKTEPIKTEPPKLINQNYNWGAWDRPSALTNIPANKSTSPEMDLVDTLSNISMGTWDRPTGNIPTQPLQKDRESGGRSGVTWQNNPLKAAGANIYAGFGSLGRNTANVADMLGGSNVPLVKDWIEDVKKSSQYEDDRLAKINQTGGTVGEFAGSVFQGIGQSIPSMAMSLASVPYAAANQIGNIVNPTTLDMIRQSVGELIKNPNIIPSLIQGVGSQYEQAINQGATKEQAIKSAIIGGVPSGLIETLGGTENLANKLASKMPFGRTVLESGLGEALEEIIQYPIENLGQKLSYDKDMPLYSTTEQALINPKEQLYSGASAFVSSALMGGAGVGINNLMNKLDTKQRNVVVSLEEGLNEIYTAIDNGVQATEQDLNKTIQTLQEIEKQYPELSEYLQGHISKVDIYKQQIAETFTQPTANENIEANTLVEQDANIAQNSLKDLTDDIAVSNTPTTNVLDNTLQEVNNDVTEMQQMDNRIVDDNKTIDDFANNSKIEEMQAVDNVDNVTNVTEQINFKPANELNKDNPYLENDFNPFEQENEFEEQTSRRDKWLNDKLQNIETAKFTKPYLDSSQYAIVTPSIKDGKYQITVFDNDNTPIMDSQRDTIEEVVKELDSQGFTYIEEINTQAIEQPTTNETVQYEQIVNEDTNIAQNEDKDAEEETKEVVAENETTEKEDAQPEIEEITNQTIKQTTKGFKGEESFTRKNNKDLIDMSRKLKKPTDIRKDITKMFSVPNTTKKFNRSKKFLGYYKVMPEVIRLKYDNDIGVVMHELGHHLDKKYGFNKSELINDMISKMNPAFKKNYQASELPGEAIAEFLRYYTTDSTTAAEFAGDFYNLFEQTLDKKDLKNIQAVRSDVLRWVNAEWEEKAMSTITPLSQKESIGERISDMVKFEKVNSILFDKYAPLQNFVNTVEKLTGMKLKESLNPHVLVERTYKNDALIEGLIKGQLRDTQFKELDTDDSLQKIVDDTGKDMRKFELYLKLKHALTLQNKGHQIFNKEIEVSQDKLDMMELENPQFKELSERLYNWYDKFFKAWVVDTNMLGKDSKKVYDKMREEYPYYVPMFRVREDGSSKRTSSSLTDQKAPVDRLSEKGSDRDTISPIDNIITQVSRMVNAYTKNNVMRAIVENYNTVDGLGGFIDRVPADMEKQIASTQPIKNSIEDFKTTDNEQLIDDIVNNIPDLIENYKPLTVSKDQDIVGVIAEDGSRQFYQVFDKDFLNSLTNMNPTQLDATVKMIASVRRTTTALTTGLNPIFSIASNAPRDFAQAYVLGSYKNPAEYVYQYAKALINVATKTGNYEKFKEIGGVYGSSMTSELRNRNDFIRHLDKYRKGKKVNAKNALHYVGEMILDLNDAIETAPRLSEFNKAYSIAEKKGMAEYDRLLYALRRSEDVTLNFARKGEIMNTAIGQSIPYLNAGLQGMDKLRRGLFTGEERLQTLIKALTMFTIPTILLWLAHKDDEDYERLSKGIKDNYWILWKKDDGSFARIPKPKDLATIFSSDAERALNAYFKEQGAGAFEGFQSTIADSLLPPVDTILRPLIDVAKNEKWSGSKIVGMSMENLPKTEQYDETTSKIGITLAQAISKLPFMSDSSFASPKNVDYVLDQYYGGLADILLPMTTPNSITTIEFIRRKFSADPSYSNDIVGDFYDLRDKTTKANNAYKNRKVMSDDVDFVAENQFKAYYKSISSMWKSVDYIGSLENKNLPDGHKESYKKLISYSRYADSTKQKVIEDLKDNKLNKESITMLQKTVRDEIVKLAEKSVNEYKANHKASNEELKRIVNQE